MHTRRGVLGVTAASLVGLAGCSGASPQSTTNQSDADPDAETTESGTANDDVDDPHLDWAYGEDQQILEQVQDEVDLDPVKNILEGDADTHRKIGDALLQANTQYTQEEEDYEHRHKTAVTAVTQAIQDPDLDITLTTFADWAKTPKYPSEGLDYSKVWVNDSDKDINVALNPEMRPPAYVVEGENVEGDIKETLTNLRDSEVHTERAANDYQAMQETIQYLKSTGQEFSNEKIENGYAGWISKFDNYIWGDGTPVPSSIQDWKKLHQGFESGPEMVRELNRAYREAGYDGETAQFTVEDGSVSMSDVPDGYDPAEDGVPGNPAA